MARESGDEEHGGRGGQGPAERQELGDGSMLALRPVDRDRDSAGEREEREQELEVDVAAPERVGAQEREQRAELPPRAQRELRRRQ